MSPSLSDSFIASFESLWSKILGFIPDLLGALIVLIVGLLVASLLAKLTKKAIEVTRVDRATEQIGLKEEARNLGFNLNIATLLGEIVKWFFVIITIIAVLDILHITQLSLFLEKLVLYIPQVIVAVIILMAGLIIGRFASNAAKAALSKASGTQNLANFLGALAKWSIYIFAIMSALVQLGISTSLIQILFTGLIFMLAIAGGLAFGLGGTEHARKILDRIEKELNNRQQP